LYRVWYGTNRKRADDKNISAGFGTLRSNSINYGYCDVLIPKFHKIGEIGSPWYKRLPILLKSDKLEMQSIAALPEDEFWARLSAQIEHVAVDERSLLVFVHGYNTTFEEAAIRAAQLGFDLRVAGATAFFSWPSMGTVQGYLADGAAIDASEPFIEQFVLGMAQKTGATRVHLIAHSMGNRGVLRALASVASKMASGASVPFSQIILAAPDVDSAVFQTLAAAYTKLSARTTLYVSERDRALSLVGVLHKYPRAGITPPITVLAGIDTIEVTNVDLSFLGHGYFAGLRALLTDMHVLMKSNTAPSQRFGLEQKLLAPTKVYWKFAK